ncbi:MAG: hypothetical protein PF487_12810 [Bacteroidales bacterium]|jgi:hypothetical protein|nr:hypothetical protein [Bacteroidales bacterium]
MLVALGNILVIALTFSLFIASLFLTGFTHDLLLESGVLLISIKLIIMNYKNSLANKEVIKKIDEIKEILSKK